jgi:hypothetical protein
VESVGAVVCGSPPSPAASVVLGHLAARTFSAYVTPQATPDGVGVAVTRPSLSNCLKRLPFQVKTEHYRNT